jgi:predicted hydrocarbon binding protein
VQNKPFFWNGRRLLETAICGQIQPGAKSMPRPLRSTSSGNIDFESFLTSNASTGEIRTKRDARAVVLTAESFLALADAVRDRLGDEVGDVLYRAGHAWGRQRFSEFAQDIGQAGDVLYHLRNMGVEQFKDLFNDLLICGGWGTFTIEERHEVVLVHVHNSAFHEMVSSTDRRYTDFFAGFLAGFFSDLIGVKLDAVQVGGFGDAQEPCTFLLADEAIIAAVRRWLDGGKSTADVLELIGTGEYGTASRQPRS